MFLLRLETLKLLLTVSILTNVVTQSLSKSFTILEPVSIGLTN